MVGNFRMCVDRELGWLPPEALGVRQDQGNINHENNFAANCYSTFLCDMQVLHVEIQVFYPQQQPSHWTENDDSACA